MSDRLRFLKKAQGPVTGSYVLLELTPPAFKDQTSLASEELFRVLHSAVGMRSRAGRLSKKGNIALEIVSTRNNGIRYLIRVRAVDRSHITKSLDAFMPEMHIRQISEYLPKPLSLDQGLTRVLSYRLSHNYTYPLNDHYSLGLSDPVSYLLSSMSSLNSDELISLQISLKPYRLIPRPQRNTKLVKGQAPPSGMAKDICQRLIKISLDLFEASLECIGDTMTSSYFRSYRSPGAIKPAPISPTQRKTLNAVENKLSDPLFLTNLRVFVKASNKETLNTHVQAINAALSIYDRAGQQSLTPEHFVPHYLNNLLKEQFLKRSVSRFMVKRRLFSPAEIAAIYHFPISKNGHSENIKVSHSKLLPPPLLRTESNELDVLIGKNNFKGSLTPIGLTLEERTKHVYVVGGTGNGKSTLLEYAIVQDMRSNKGLAVIDPHGDLAESLLGHVPKERLKDVVYFSPDDTELPLSMNLLEISPGLTKTELIREKELITEATLTVLRKLFSSEDTNSHRIEYVLRNVIQTVLTTEKPTLFTLYDLLTDNRFRYRVVSDLSDIHLKNFWQNELGRAGDYQRVKMLSGITAKIGRFIFSNFAASVLAQQSSTLDIEDIMSTSKILICNLSKGLIGEDNSSFFGSIVLAKLQIAAMKRARLTNSERRDFFLYIDEFQNFASQSFIQLLSEARKYHLFITMAEQSAATHLNERLIDSILANTGCVITFRSGSPNDERLLLPLFRPYLDNGDIAGLSTHNFYVKLASSESFAPLSGETVCLTDKGSHATSTRVKQLSKIRYGRRAVHLIGEAQNTRSKGTRLKTYPVPSLH